MIGKIEGQGGLKPADKALLIPTNIKSGVTIDGVVGTAPTRKASGTVTIVSGVQNYTIDIGFLATSGSYFGLALPSAHVSRPGGLIMAGTNCGLISTNFGGTIQKRVFYEYSTLYMSNINPNASAITFSGTSVTINTMVTCTSGSIDWSVSE